MQIKRCIPFTCNTYNLFIIVTLMLYTIPYHIKWRSFYETSLEVQTISSNPPLWLIVCLDGILLPQDKQHAQGRHEAVHLPYMAACTVAASIDTQMLQHNYNIKNYIIIMQQSTPFQCLRSVMLRGTLDTTRGGQILTIFLSRSDKLFPQYHLSLWWHVSSQRPKRAFTTPP